MPKVRRSQRSQSLDHGSDLSKTGASAFELERMRTVMHVLLSSGVRGNQCECLLSVRVLQFLLIPRTVGEARTGHSQEA